MAFTDLTFQLKEKGNDSLVIDLVYDEELNAAYQMHLSSHDLTGAVNPLFHVPDSAPPQLLDMVPENRTLFFRANLMGAGEDDTLNKIAALARWIDGEGQQAARHHTRGDVRRIEVQVQPDGATNYTILPVIYGGFETFAALLGEFGLVNQGAHSFGVSLIVDPHGEGPKIDVSLANYMGNLLTNSTYYISAAFLEDSNADGLADGWAISGSPPFMPKQLVSSPALIGGQSQEVTFEDTSDILETRDITTPTGSLYPYGFYIWCCIGSFEGTFEVGLYGSSLHGAIEFDTSDPTANALDTAVDPDGNTWYKIGSDLLSLNYSPLTFRIDCTAVTTSGTMYFDGAYLHFNSSGLPPYYPSIPRTWVSQSSLKNRGDIMLNTTDHGHNWFDVWGIPGDAPAIARWKITADTLTLKRRLVVARWRDTEHKIADFVGEIESNDSGWTYPAGWTNGSLDAANDHYKRFTSSGSGTTAEISLSGAAARAVLAGTRRIFVRAQTNDVTSTIVMNAYIGTDDSGQPVADSTAVTLNNGSAWEWVDLGTINGEQLAPISDFWGSSSPTLNLRFTLDVPNTKTFDLDFVRVLPTEEFLDHTTVDAWLDYLTTDTLWIDGHSERVFLANESPQPAGSMFYLQPGVLNRIYFAFLYTSGAGLPDAAYSASALAETFTVELEITPRTRHLLGTA